MKFTTDINILYVEDDEIDLEALKRSFEKNQIENKLFTAANGLEALEMLRGANAIVPRPRIVLLDINMPKMNGIEFLKEMRQDPEIKNLTVFVLTTSDQDEDVNAAHRFNVAGYIVKPATSAKLTEAIGNLKSVWEASHFPPQ